MEVGIYPFIFMGFLAILFLSMTLISFVKKQPKPWRLVVVLILSIFMGYSIKSEPFYLDCTVPLIFLVLFLFYPVDETSKFFSLGESPLMSLVVSLLVGLVFSFLFFRIDTQIATQAITIYSGFYVVTKAMSEEILFRGFLLNDLRKFGFAPIIANILQTIVFVLGHSQSFHSIYFALLVFGFGFIAGLLVIKRETLIYSMILHIVTNMFVFYIAQPNPLIHFYPL